MSGEESSMIVIMMIVCSCSIALTAGLGYTCTGGSFGLDDFDMDKCLEWPKKSTSNTTPTSTTTPGGGGGGSQTVPDSQDLTICGTQFFSNESRTCFTGSEQVGVRWAWLNSDTASSCRDKVAKYLVEVSSSIDNHNTKKMYNVLGKDANSVIISGASSLMTSGGNAQNVKIYITPLDASGAKISETAVAEVDTGSSDTDTCEAIGGTAVPFADFLQVTAGAAETGEGCSGGTWSPPGPCMADDGVTELTGEVGKCGTGSALLTLSGQTPASAGGSCVVEKRERCTKPCPEETPSDCLLARLPPSPNGEEGGVVWNPYPGSPDYIDACKTQCKASGATTEEIYQSANVLEDAVGEGGCTFSQETTCECPRDCVGHWTSTGTESGRHCVELANLSWTNNMILADYNMERFDVTTPANSTGECPNAGKSRKTKTRMYYYYYDFLTKKERDLEISADGTQVRQPPSSSTGNPWWNFSEEHLRLCPPNETIG